MERKQLQSLIDSLESVKRATQKAAETFEEVGELDENGAWWVRDSAER